MNGNTVISIHFIKLIDTYHSSVSQNHSSSFYSKFSSARVFNYRCS
jgi:hypothetical protein